MDAGTGDRVSKGIIAAFTILGSIVVLLGAIFLSVYLNALILGSVFQVGLNGSLPVTTTTLSFLNTTESSFFGANNSVLSGLTFATSLIPIAIILLVLGGVIVGGVVGYRYLKKKGKGGDMGY